MKQLPKMHNDSSDNSTNTSDSDGDSAYNSDSDNVQDLKQAKVLKY